MALTPGRGCMDLPKISRGHMSAGIKGSSLYSQQTLVEHIQLILIVHGLYICKFAYSLKCICDPKINIHNAFTVINRHAQSNKKIELPHVLINSWGHTRQCFENSFSFCTSPYYKQVSLHG